MDKERELAIPEWTPEQLLYLETIDFLYGKPESSILPQFDWRDHRMTDMVKRAIRYSFDDNDVDKKERETKVAHLNRILSPHFLADTTIDEEGKVVVRRQENIINTDIPPMSAPDALCVKSELPFYYDEGKPTRKDERNVYRAKQICQQCSHQNECLDWGRTHHLGSYAIFGGALLNLEGKVLGAPPLNIKIPASKTSIR